MLRLGLLLLLNLGSLSATAQDIIVPASIVTGVTPLPTLIVPHTCRSETVKHRFDKQNGYPHGRPDQRVDHICALECGGIDDVSNMQYQSIADAKLKDKWELTPAGCAKTCTPLNSTPTRQVFNCKGHKNTE
jgi:hypothetical protein